MTRPVLDAKSVQAQMQLYSMGLGKAMQPGKTSTVTGRLVGKQPSHWIIDDFAPAWDPDRELHAHLAPMLHDLGLLNKKDFVKMASRARRRFVAHALKRARSNHPHNIRWKPLLGAQTAFLVARELER